MSIYYKDSKGRRTMKGQYQKQFGTGGLGPILANYYSGILSPGDQRKQARKDTNLAIQDSMRQLRTTYQQERERTLREQYAQGQWAGLLKGYGGEGSGGAGAIRDAYATAAGLSSKAGQGFIDSTTAQQGANVDAANADAANLAGYNGPNVMPDAGANASVLSYLNSLPAGTFAADAEREATGLGSASAKAGSEFAFREAQLGQALREMSDKYTMGVKDVQSKRGGMFQDALKGLQESGRGDLATIINAMYLQNTQDKTMADITGVGPDGRPTVAATVVSNNAKDDAARRRAEQQRIAIARMNARTTQRQANISQQNANTAALAQSGKTGAAEQKFRSDARKYMADLFGKLDRRGKPQYRPATKAAIVRQVYEVYGQALISSGNFTEKQVKQWATQIVNTFPQKWWSDGYWKKGPKGPKGTKKPGTSPEDIINQQ
jgi:hypothetical protein